MLQEYGPGGVLLCYCLTMIYEIGGRLLGYCENVLIQEVLLLFPMPLLLLLPYTPGTPGERGGGGFSNLIFSCGEYSGPVIN